MEDFMEIVGIIACAFLFLFIVGGFIVNWGDGDDKGNSLRGAAVLYLVLMSFSVGVHVGSQSTVEDKVEPAVDVLEEVAE